MKIKNKYYVAIVLLIGVIILTGCSGEKKKKDEASIKYSMNNKYWNSDKMREKKEKLLELVDSEGFCIKDGVLIAYIGTKKIITIPATVTQIGENALAGDMYSTTVSEVIVPGTVKKVDARAFAFTAADVIRFEEGVEEIGESCFMDAYVKEVYYPESLKKAGKLMMETEEGLDGTVIYVVSGSYMENYFKTQMPYGDCTLKSN